MRIGIDISQLAYTSTGVANYLSSLVAALIRIDTKHEYVLFFSSLRGELPSSFMHEIDAIPEAHVTLKQYAIPQSILRFLWNQLHVLPIEIFTGDVDVFISSDWTQPPVKRAKNVTILYDLIVYKFPEEMDTTIVTTQKQRLKWVKKETDLILCISEATKRDAVEFLHVKEQTLKVIHPGLTI